jgi:hypothetical protein
VSTTDVQHTLHEMGRRASNRMCVRQSGCGPVWPSRQHLSATRALKGLLATATVIAGLAGQGEVNSLTVHRAHFICVAVCDPHLTDPPFRLVRDRNACQATTTPRRDTPPSPPPGWAQTHTKGIAQPRSQDKLLSNLIRSSCVVRLVFTSVSFALNDRLNLGALTPQNPLYL